MNVLFEAPLARAIIATHGREAGLEVLRRYGADDVDARIETMAWDAVRSKVERNPDPGSGGMHIQCVFALTAEPEDDADAHARMVYWDNQGIVVCGATTPETTLPMLEGRGMTDLLDHPHLEGLTIGNVHNHVDGDTVSLVADASDCMWDMARIEAEIR